MRTSYLSQAKLQKAFTLKNIVFMANIKSLLFVALIFLVPMNIEFRLDPWMESPNTSVRYVASKLLIKKVNNQMKLSKDAIPATSTSAQLVIQKQIKFSTSSMMTPMNLKEWILGQM